MKLKRKEQKEAERIEQDITFRIKIPNDSNAKSSPIRSHRLFNRPRKNALTTNVARQLAFLASRQGPKHGCVAACPPGSSCNAL